MPEPRNYLLNIPDPTQKVLEGLKTAETIYDFRQKKIANEKAQARTEQMTLDIGSLNANSKAEDYVRFSNKYPEIGEQLLKNWGILDQSNKESKLRFAGQVMSAMRSNPEIGIKLLEERAVAERNSDNEEAAKGYETYAELAKIDPELVIVNIGTMLSLLPGGSEKIESVIDIAEEARLKDLHPLNYELLQTKSEQALLDFKNAQEGGLYTKAKDLQRKAEGDIRKEYTQNTKAYDKIKGQYKIAKAAILQKTGVADVALVFTFMKILDPDSVVRESEYKAAIETTGVDNRIRAFAEKLKTGEKLTDEHKLEFKSMIDEIMQISQDVRDKKIKGIESTIDFYGLEYKNVFGEERPVKKETVGDGQTRSYDVFKTGD